MAAADSGAKLFVGLREAMTRAQFKEALHSGTVAQYVHKIRVKTGDAMFLPAGRLHGLEEESSRRDPAKQRYHLSSVRLEPRR